MTTEHGAIRQLEAEGRWAEAAASWRQLLATTADNSQVLEIRSAMVRCLWHDCRPQDATEELRISQQLLTPDTPPVLQGRLLLEQGRLSESLGRYKSARETYREARHLLSGEGAESHEALLLLARLARETGERQEAREALDALDDANITALERTEMYDELGCLLIDGGQYEEAAATLTRALEFDHQTTDYRRAHTRLRLAEAYIGIGRAVDAEKALGDSIQEFRDVHDHRGLSEAYELLGRLYELQQLFHRASKAYHDGLEQDFKSQDVVGQARAYRHLARCYRNLGEASNAESAIDQAEFLLPLEHDVEKAALWIEQGHLDCDTSDYDSATRAFDNAIKLIAPDNDPRRLAIAHRGKARALREDSKLKEAAELLTRTRDEWPENGDRREYDDLLDDLAEVFLELDDYNAAKQYLEESLAIGEEVGTPQSNGRTLLLLSQVSFALGDWQDAEHQLEEALEAFEDTQNGIGNTSLRIDALTTRGAFHLAQGQVDKAIETLSLGLKLATRRSDPIRVARAQRELGACYRRRGDFRRAEDFLDDAEMELRDTDDRMERELLSLEQVRLDLSTWQHADVAKRINSAKAFFAASPVKAAICDRLLGRLAADSYRYDESLELFEQAREVLERQRAKPELDDTFDDIAEVYLHLRQYADAQQALEVGFHMGGEIGWKSGTGRTLLLKAQLAMLQGDVNRARAEAERALESFNQAADQLGASESQMVLGDCLCADNRCDSAVEMYKKARRSGRGHMGPVQAASSYRRIGFAYLQLTEYQRAEEALEEALDHLDGILVARELAPLERDRGQLEIDWRNRHEAAIGHFERSLRHYREIGDEVGTADLQQRLIASHQALNQHDAAFRYMQEMGLRNAAMWTMLAKELDPTISDAVTRHFAQATYAAAIQEGFQVVEGEIRKYAAAAGQCVTDSGNADTTIPIQAVLRTWLVPGESWPMPTFAKNGLISFRDLSIAGFEFIRNPGAHGGLTIGEVTAQQAFTSLCIASLILTQLRSAQ